MNTIKYFFLSFAIFFSLSLISCKKETHEPYIENFAIEKTNCKWKEGVEVNKLFVINTVSDFESFISCPDKTPNIDFSKKTLLLVKVQSGSGISNIEKKLENVSSDIVFTIYVKVNAASVIGEAFVYVLMDKIASDKKVSLDLNFNC